jgi:hypothetical protein
MKIIETVKCNTDKLRGCVIEGHHGGEDVVFVLSVTS